MYTDDDEDECDDGDEKNCSSGGICIARGNFALRKCLMLGWYHNHKNIDNRQQYTCMYAWSHIFVLKWRLLKTYVHCCMT